MDAPHPLSAAALFGLKDWVAVVTGGGTGVGLMIAQTLAANGAKVYITGRRADVLETSARLHGAKDQLGEHAGEILPLVMDVTDKESIKSAAAKIGEKEGYLNVLVNNAGVWKSRPAAKPTDGPEAFGAAMFAEEIEDNWQQSFLTNATSPYFVTAAFLPLLAKAISSPAKQVGTVINNASISGLLRMTQNSQYSYNASKAAAIHVTRQMAYDLSHENINVRVNGLALGYFPSEMTTGASNDDNQSNYDVEQFRAFLQSMGVKTVKRMGSPREIASVILTLVTNDFLWGTVTILDGGFTLNLPGNM
ncbi:NAD(P)-binding protein [Xylaria bambusicola]|uniref:NAD(P)-binding protein n=1 Tax=Xylaria bambusicola TaxID=326684 RepID=UPI0020075E25|nr:NAD(P)-binding protein [Xylaria bambusicola]KAI0516934.1 NAD(P)-binding protein [Xylaria bambusicola]